MTNNDENNNSTGSETGDKILETITTIKNQIVDFYNNLGVAERAGVDGGLTVFGLSFLLNLLFGVLSFGSFLFLTALAVGYGFYRFNSMQTAINNIDVNSSNENTKTGNE